MSKACLQQFAVYWDFMNKCHRDRSLGRTKQKILSPISSKEDSGEPSAKGSAASCYFHLAHLKKKHLRCIVFGW